MAQVRHGRHMTPSTSFPRLVAYRVPQPCNLDGISMNIQEENSALYFRVQSEREQTLVHYFLSASLNLLYYVPNNLYLTLIASF